ncbi:hypothetical protein [Pseudooceanicola sp. MF1-13]|uniref:hypothetical protein n=1 Tax=Pseudooceanicola sp. MF1-13 TaxID=3379095 RepID=UPI003892C25B
MKNQTLLTKLRGGASVLVLAAAATVALPMVFPDLTGSVAYAQDGNGNGNGDGSGQGAGGANGQGSGGSGGHSDGHDHDTDAGDSDEGDSDGRGPEYGQPSGDAGGKPDWAQEGIPEVELGRLNVARSPAHVLNQALEEALSTFTPAMLDFYNLSLEDAISALRNDWDNLTLYDSPLQNLALLDAALSGTNSLSTYGVINDLGTLASIYLGLASDKTVTISDDTAEAVSIILGHDLTDAQIDALAASAEAVRLAALDGHG